MRDTKRDKRKAEALDLPERARLESLHRVSTSQAAFAHECLGLQQAHDIDAAFRRTLTEMLHAAAKLGLPLLEASIFELRPDGRLRLPHCVRLGLSDERDFADMRIEHDPTTGSWLEPGPGAGLAAYCVWFNLQATERALAIARDIATSPDIELLVAEQSEHGLTAYQPRRVPGIWKPGRVRRRGTTLVAPIYLPQREQEASRCIGALNLNHVSAHALDQVPDQLWSDVCAARIGEAYATFHAYRGKAEPALLPPRLRLERPAQPDPRALADQTCLPNANEITALRRKLGKKQETVASEAGLHVRTVRTAETGSGRVRRSTIARLARALNVPEQRLIVGE